MNEEELRNKINELEKQLKILNKENELRSGLSKIDADNLLKEKCNYRNAFEELKSIYNHDDSKSKTENMILYQFKKVEKKYGIGGNHE